MPTIGASLCRVVAITDDAKRSLHRHGSSSLAVAWPLHQSPWLSLPPILS